MSTHKRIDELMQLQAKWDSYDALPPSSNAGTTAHALVDLFDAFGLKTRVYPTLNGGIQFESDDRPVEIEVNNVGNIIVERFEK